MGGETRLFGSRAPIAPEATILVERRRKGVKLVGRVRQARKKLRGRFQRRAAAFHDARYPDWAGRSQKLSSYLPERNVEPNQWLSDRILSGEPFCAARFGADEFEITQQWRRKTTRGPVAILLEALASGDPTYVFFRSRARIKKRGLTPLTRDVHERFFTLMVESMRGTDLLGSWITGEAWFANETRDAVFAPRKYLEPYRHDSPWSQALDGKRVVVVHPFGQSIRNQYERNREQIFGKRRVLPEFTLETFMPPRAHFGEIRDAEHWFELLDELICGVSALDFDVAIIGAGPFGLPLAAAVKRAGKQAIHLGGATQILFGIRGARWERDAVVKGLMNDNWVRPLPAETPPPQSRRMSESSYW